MPRFRFRLQTLRRLREIERDEVRVRLATAYEAQRILAEQQAATSAAINALSDAQRQIMQQGAVDVNRLLAGQRYQLALEAEQRALAAQAVKLDAEVEKRRQALVEADRQVRTLDRLEERQREHHRAAEDARETKRMDEVGSIRWEANNPWA